MFQWLIGARFTNQVELLRLYRFSKVCDRPEYRDATRCGFQLLVGAAFALWRAAFLADADQPPVVRPPFKFLHAERCEGTSLWGGWPVPQRTMRALRVVAVAPSFHDHPRLVQRIEEFAVEQFIPQFCSVIPSLRQASTTASPLPNSISMVRNCPMISSVVYRLRAMLPPVAGRDPNSRSGLVYRGQVNLIVRVTELAKQHPSFPRHPMNSIGRISPTQLGKVPDDIV